MKTDNVKILWGVNIQCDHVIEARRPDIVVVNKVERKCTIIDIAVTGDSRISDKEKEKVENYQDLKMEIKIIIITSNNNLSLTARIRGEKVLELMVIENPVSCLALLSLVQAMIMRTWFRTAMLLMKVRGKEEKTIVLLCAECTA